MAKNRHQEQNPVDAVAAQVAAAHEESKSSALPDRECCARCSAFRQKEKTPELVGWCQLSPPQVVNSGGMVSSAAWPVVYGETGWCCQFKKN